MTPNPIRDRISRTSYKRPPGPLMRVTAALGALLMLFVACGSDESPRDRDEGVQSDDHLADDDPGENQGEYDHIYRNPAEYVGEDVTLSGTILEIYDERTLRMTSTETPEVSLLVSHPGNKNLEVEELIRVVGVMTEGEDVDLPPSAGDDEHVIVVDDVTHISITGVSGDYGTDEGDETE